MNPRSRPLLAVALAALSATPAAAQWDWDAEVGAGLSRVENIFRAPSALQVGGVQLPPDSLVQGDLAVPLHWGGSVSRDWGRHAVDLDYASSLRRYGRHGHLAGGAHRVGLAYSLDVSDRLAVEAEMEGRRSRTVATDALGEELTRLFEYGQASATGSLTWEPARRHEVGASYRWRTRDYRETEGAPSLDYEEHTAEATWDYERRARRGRRWYTAWGVGVAASYRLKEYGAYPARDAGGRQRGGAPTNVLHHYTLGAEAQRALTSSMEGAVQVRGVLRVDPYEGFYSYRSTGASGELEWDLARGTSVVVGLGWRRVLYDVKAAPQADPAEGEPRLQYDYVDWEVGVERRVGRALTVTAFGESGGRRSNTTLESRTTRRSYAEAQVGLSVEVDLDRLHGTMR